MSEVEKRVTRIRDTPDCENRSMKKPNTKIPKPNPHPNTSQEKNNSNK